MELRKSLDFRKIVIVLYFVAFGIYLLVGLAPAEAADLVVATEIEIHAIDLKSDVTMLEMKDHELTTPDDIVGGYTRAKNKTFLVGHSTGVFSRLNQLGVGEEIIYDLVKYTVTKVEILEKSEISMNKLLLPAEKDTIVLMTCAGELLDGGDATHRLIITAVTQ